MQIDFMKKAIIAGWALGLGVLAFSLNLTSLGGWTILVGLGVLPPLVMLKMWNPPGPAKTMSERIRDAKK